MPTPKRTNPPSVCSQDRDRRARTALAYYEYAEEQDRFNQIFFALLWIGCLTAGLVVGHYLCALGRYALQLWLPCL